MGEIIEVTAIDEEEETIKYSVPRIQIGMNNFQLFITSKRMTFIKTGKDYRAVGNFLIGYLGEKMVERYNKDDAKFHGQDLDALIKEDANNFEIPVERVTRIRLKLSLGYYYMHIFGTEGDYLEMRLVKGRMEPSKSYSEECEIMGLNIGQAQDAYALECQKVIERCFGDKLTLKLKLKE